MKRYEFPGMPMALVRLRVGSPEWLEGLSMAVQSGFDATERNGGRHLIEALKEVLDYEPWLVIPINHPAGNAKDYIEGVTGQPYEATVLIVEGLSDKALADRLKELARESVGKATKHGTNQHSEGGHDNVMSSQGNAATYTLARLKRDHPDLAVRVVAGELTANAAAIQAGFRRKTWSAPDDPEQLAQAVAKRYPGWQLTKKG